LKDNPDADGCSGPLQSPAGMPSQMTRTFIYRILPVPKDEIYEETFPGTTFAMYRNRAFVINGGFNEVYYFYNEDLDWVTRANKRESNFY
jgi:GT2 family glycosyltransferase